jgi:putative tryptophan/tyrosine transport system substrate-binding protein
MWCRTVGCIVILILSLLTPPRASQAQHATHVPRLGLLMPGSATGYASRIEAFRHGLRDLGYVEGRTITLEYRFNDGQFDQLPALVAELVQLPVDLLVVDGATAVRAAQHATTTIPIVMAVSAAPVEAGFVASLARPGGNITGLTLHDPEVIGKRLELLTQAVPGITRVAYLWHAVVHTARHLHEAERAARALGVQLHPVEVREPYPFEQAFAAMAEAHADALLTQPSAVFWDRRTQIVDLAARQQLPGSFPEREFVEVGGFMAYGPSVTANFRRAATYVDKILKGTKPADLPVEQPTKFELVLNLKTAEARGLTLPPTLLFQADEVIR